MPNWCDHVLTITGESKDLQLFAENLLAHCALDKKGHTTGRCWLLEGIDLNSCCEFCSSIKQYNYDNRSIEINYSIKNQDWLDGVIHLSKNYPTLTFIVNYSIEYYAFPDAEVTIKEGRLLHIKEDSEAETKWKIDHIVCGLPL